MKEPSKLITASDLGYLTRGECQVPVTQLSFELTAAQYAKQAESIRTRQINASVVGIILSSAGLALVERDEDGSNPGWALTSGSLDPYDGKKHEHFRDALNREVGQELGVELEHDPNGLVSLEERIFTHGKAPAQRIYVATFLAHTLHDQIPHQTKAATEEKLIVANFALGHLPEQFAFRDGEKIAAYVPTALVA